MTSTRRPVFAVVLSALGIACATATAPDTGGGTSGGSAGDGGGIVDAAGGYGWGGEGGGRPSSDSGTPIVHSDSGTITPIDSGTVTVIDSGTTATPEFCSGSTSSYDGSSYTSWCTYDYDYYDTTGSAYACASNDDCQTHGVTGCCFQPKTDSNCYKDYGGVPQCVPQ